MGSCSNCLINSSVDSKIQFDKKGVCNYCLSYYKAHNHSQQLIAKNHFQDQIQSIKRSNNSSYDCILGVSGGTDSSYVAYLLKKEGLNVLMVHCDNGWDTEIAVSNLKKIKEITGFDLLIRKMDTAAFYAVQRSFLKARVVDIELLSDHVNIASIYEVANQKKIPWIVTGENINTEFFMPQHWVHNKNDWQQICAINNRFEKADTSSFPKLGPYKKYVIDQQLRINYFKPLNYIDYNKDDATKVLKKEFDWQDHGGKHFESNFTVFFQCYILPEFFKVDKRIAHLSNLICSGILSRKKAQQLLSEPTLPQNKLKYLKKYILSKLELTENEFIDIMAKPISSHSNYRSHFVYNKYLQKVIQAFK